MTSMSRPWRIALISLAGLSLPAWSTNGVVKAQSIDNIVLPPSVPQKIRLTDKPADPSGKLVKVRYGPFTVPANTTFAALPEFLGGAKIYMPCEECYLGKFQAGLEYEDGTEANIDTGMYLHHFVIVNWNKPDWLCGLRLGGMFRPQYVYNSGNERQPVRLNTKYKFGMRVDKGDTFTAATEIMNMSNKTKTVYQTMIYEVVPLNTPGYREATHLRVEIWQCGTSDVPAKVGAYKYTGPNVTSPYSGVILHDDGHGHDGSTEVNFLINNTMSCNSKAYYGLRPGWIPPKDNSIQQSGSHAHEMQYISDVVVCENYGRLEKGDVMRIEASYDGNTYPQMEARGHLESQMGISFLYIGRDEHTLKDKLPFTYELDALPKEMNYTSILTNFIGIETSSVNITRILNTLGLPETFNLSQIIPAVPAWFNISDPLVNSPIAPFNLMTFNTIAENWKDMGDWVLSMMDAVLKMFVPTLPQNFKLSNTVLPGGINVDEVEILSEAIYQALGIPDPFHMDGELAHNKIIVGPMYSLAHRRWKRS